MLEVGGQCCFLGADTRQGGRGGGCQAVLLLSRSTKSFVYISSFLGLVRHWQQPLPRTCRQSTYRLDKNYFCVGFIPLENFYSSCHHHLRQGIHQPDAIMGQEDKLKRCRASEDELLTYEDATEAGAIAPPPHKRARTEAKTSLFVRCLPNSMTSESLTELFSEYFPVKHAHVVLDPATKESRGYGFVTFTDAEDASAARAKLNGHLVDKRRLVLEVAEPRYRDEKRRAEEPEKAAEADLEKQRRREAVLGRRKAPKLIIRNLPWSIKTPDQLSRLFLSFGKVKYADLPKSKGRLSGFGFVTLRRRRNAERAMEALNGKQVDGRTIAVDWAVDKDTWEKEKMKEDGIQEETERKNQKASSQAGGTEKKATTGSSFDPDADVAAFMEKMEEFESESDGDVDDDHGEAGGQYDKNDAQTTNYDGSGSEVECDDMDNEEEAKSEKSTTRKTDNSSTIFIRNLPYTTTDEELKCHFSRFGDVNYARVVMNRTTEKSAGTGFVRFYNADEMKKCVANAPRPQAVSKGKKQSILQDEHADLDGSYTLDGRLLQVTQAVSKEEAAKLTEDGPGSQRKRQNEGRRLYLLSEGTIRTDSPLHACLPPSEIKMRQASLAQRKKLVQSNPSLHLSLTRLALRNIPGSVDSKQLKALAREAVVGFAKDVRQGRRQPLSKEEIARGGAEGREAERRRKEKGKGIVQQAKIVYEDQKGSKVGEDTGAGRSRGYGFLEYSSHRWALMGLRWLNGYAMKNEAGRTQRLIVEFAIENAQVVSRRRENQAKAATRRAPTITETENPVKGHRSNVKDAKIPSSIKMKRNKGR